MTEPEKPVSDAPAAKPANAPSGVFTQANITLGLSVLAVILAGAPYVVPQLQAYQVRNGLMAKPAMLQDASQKLREQQVAEATQKVKEGVRTHQASLFNDKNDPVLGNPNAPIKVVEFLDYNCGYCRAASPQLKALLAENPDVQLIIKEYPVINQTSRPLAAFALGAAKLGQYEKMHYALMETRPESYEQLAVLISRIGLDPQLVREAAESEEVNAHIDRVTALGYDIGVTGTPAFVIGTTVVDGAKIDELKAAIQAERARLKKR